MSTADTRPSRAGPGLPRRWVERAALALAIASLVGWWAALAASKPGVVADERIHFGVVSELRRGDTSSVGLLPMPPAYHYALAAALALLPDSLASARALNAAIALVGLLVAHRLTAGQPPWQRAVQVLLLAWNPLLLPFTALVYTDTLALVLVLTALWAERRGRRGWAALAIALSCAVRQSNVLWAAYLVGLCMIRPRVGAAPAELHELGSMPLRAWVARAGRAWPCVLVLAAMLAIFAGHGAVVAGGGPANRIQFNPAQYYLFAMIVIGLWLPLWVAELPGAWREWLLPALRSPAVCVGALAAGGAAALLYDNPHPWNGDPKYLRNLLLIALGESEWLRLSLGLASVLVGALAVRFASEQPARTALALTFAFSLLWLAPHGLAEPRYAIVPVALLHLHAGYGRNVGVALVLWQGAMSLAIAVYVVVYGGEQGGIW